MARANSATITISREQAIRDGVLVDVTPVAVLAGWVAPVGFTRAAYAAVCDCTPYERLKGFTPHMRVREVLSVAAEVIKNAGELEYILRCGVAIARSLDTVSTHTLQLVGHPYNQEGEFCLTIALWNE